MLFLTPTAVLHGLLRTSFSIFWFAIGLFSIIFSIANNDAIGAEKHKLASSRTKTAAAFPSTRPYGQRPDVMALADAIAAEHQADPQWVRTQLAQAHHIPSITQYILPAPSGTAKNWRVYRSRFVEPIRIAAGVKFWKAHVALLERAEQTYGVPPEIVVGIIGVESIYGRQTGNFRVIDALVYGLSDKPSACCRTPSLLSR
jgi:membrane-bound lytic murein transglycosylase B